MRTSFSLLLVVVTLAACAFADAKESAQASIPNSNTRTSTTASTHRYLKGSNANPVNEDTTAATRDEERIAFSGGDKLKSLLQKVPKLNKVKSLFQKNPSLVKSLEKPGLKEKLSAFFKENPAIKKELIIAAVLLTLIVGTPIVVNSFY
jgi:hypothetical protein